MSSHICIWRDQHLLHASLSSVAVHRLHTIDSFPRGVDLNKKKLKRYFVQVFGLVTAVLSILNAFARDAALQELCKTAHECHQRAPVVVSDKSTKVSENMSSMSSADW